MWRKCRNFLHHTYTHLAQGDFRGWYARMRSQWYALSEKIEAVDEELLYNDYSFAILYTVNTVAIACRIASRLRSHGWLVELFVGDDHTVGHDWYFVLDPASPALPPKEKRWCYLTSDIEITAETKRALSMSAAVLTATCEQIEHLARLNLSYPQVHYLSLPNATMCTDDFDFMLDRFLVAQQVLPVRVLLSNKLPIADYTSAVVLSMPETIERHKMAEKMLPSNYEWFCGIRRQPGWVGCGLSYRALAQHALKHGVRRLLIVEDDALVSEAYENIMCDVQEFLDLHEGEWDIFCGMISVLHPDTTVQSVSTYKGITMVGIDRMTSMVCNVYAITALNRLAAWTPEQQGEVANTIDRYLGQPGQLRVVVALPFLVGHREDVQSTLWRTSNRMYSAPILLAERELMRKVQNYEYKNCSCKVD